MKQALHIFRKDFRYLRVAIALLMALAAATIVEQGFDQVFAVAAAGVIVLLIHAERIPGDDQFWLTRPYRPLSLLGAKLLFIVAFICLPVFAAQTALVFDLGFPLTQELPGLLWTQVLLFFAAALPVAAVASVTSRYATFGAIVLALGTTAMFGESARTTMFSGASGAETPAGWIKTLVFGATISFLSGVILLWQYRDRRTLFSGLFGASAWYIALAVYLFLPQSIPLTAETWLSKQPALADRVRVSIQPKRRREVSGFENLRTQRIPVPVVAAGVPEGMEALPDALSFEFVWPDETWTPRLPSGITPHPAARGEVLLDTLVHMDEYLFARKRQDPLTIRGTVYLTLFGASERRTIPVKQGPRNVQDRLQCFAGGFLGGDYFVCRSLFRWPASLVGIEANGTLADFGNRIVSYSPLPADLTPDPLEVRFTESVQADTATVVTKRPLVHFRRDFEFSGLRLADFEKLPRAPLPGARREEKP